MLDSEIDYQQRLQDALRGVVRDVLRDVEKEGLPGDHHFYIAFKTQYPGVDVPASLTERFPDEMTIVLQHKFWGLNVADDHFEVGLSFNQKPETLRIPFRALAGFHDPTVQFALQFQDDTATGETQDDVGAYADAQDAALLAATKEELDQEADAATQTGDDTADSANVVTLDAFRKK